jgi:UDP-2,4-diacetamido-2,4,6-trideoxy-beta-L-altropyranose hydrolase
MAEGFERRQLLIRADVGTQVGLGHVLRMLALAQAWKDLGGGVTLCTTALGTGIQERWLEEGTHWVQLPDGVEAHTVAEARFTVSVARERRCSVVVLDGYGFDVAYMEALRANGDVRVVKVVDAMPPDVEWGLLDGVVYPGLDRVVPPVPKLLAGPAYVLLRREFRVARRMKNAAGNPCICLCMGGTDPGNYLSDLVWEMAGHRERLAGLVEVRIVTTSGNPHLAVLRDALAKTSGCPWSWKLCLDVRDMAEVLSGVDAVISSASGLAWEWLSLGGRGAVMAVASNQQRFYEGLVEAGYAWGLGTPWKPGEDWDRQRLIEWIGKGGNLEGEAETKPSPVDGLGAVRVCEFLASLFTPTSGNNPDVAGAG